MEQERIFELKFIIKDGNIATKVETKNISPQECVGLLEIAKQQIIKDLEANKKEVFRGTQNE